MNRHALHFLLFALCAAAPASPGVPGPLYGVCSHITRDGFSRREESCRHIAEAGIGAVRSDVDWERCQPKRGAPFDFSFYDAALESCGRRGLRFLPILMRPPQWASPLWEHLEEWGAFVEAFVRRYGARCPDVEILNEPNLRAFWGAEPDPDRYFEVLKAAYEAAKRANPRVRVLLGGLNGVPLRYIRRLYERGGAAYFDVMCVHPYTHPMPPDPGLARELDALRALMVEFGDGDKPIAITELGWPTHDTRVEGLPLLRALLRAAHPERDVWRCVYAATSPGPGGGPPQDVARAVAGALPPGSSCEACFGARLRERLAAGDVDAVIYPFDETFPVDTFEDVLAFVRDGGTLVDLGGSPMWYPCRETAPGVFERDPVGENAEPLRTRMRLGLAAFWTDPALPREGRAFPTADALAAGYKGDPAGERVHRFQTPEHLLPGDAFVPLLAFRDASGRSRAAASLVRYGAHGWKGCVAVGGSIGRGSAAAGASEEDQARYLVRALEIALERGIDSFYWYEFRSPEKDPHYSEDHFGLVHKDFSPKPALAAYRDFIANRPAGPGR